MCLINQHIPKPRLPLPHIHNRPIRLPQRPRLNPRLHTLLHRQLQHLLNLPRRPDRTSPNLTALRDQRERVERRHLVLGSANLDELPVRAEKHQILLQGHVRRGDGADDEVEGTRVVRRPIGIVVCGNVRVRAELGGVSFLGRAAGDGGDFGGS